MRRFSKHDARRRAGFIIFFGWRGVKGSDGTPPLQAVCPLCRAQATLRGRVVRRWFTLFFVPVIPIQSVAQGYRFTECTTCKGEISATIDQLTRTAPARAGVDHQTAIRLYNHLRDHPDDSAALLELVQTYIALGEKRDAETACRTFTRAYEKDPAIERALRG